MLRNSITVSTKQERIAALAKQSPQMAFTSLAYLMDIDWLKEAYRRTRKGGWTSPRKTGAQLRMFFGFELRRGDVPQR